MFVTSSFYEQSKFLKSPQNKWVIFESSFLSNQIVIYGEFTAFQFQLFAVKTKFLSISQNCHPPFQVATNILFKNWNCLLLFVKKVWCIQFKQIFNFLKYLFAFIKTLLFCWIVLTPFYLGLWQPHILCKKIYVFTDVTMTTII